MSPTPGPPGIPSDPAPASVLSSIGWREVLQSAVGIAVAVAVLILGLPRITGTTWPQIANQLHLLGLGSATLMAALLLTGLYCYTHTMIASLPGLNHLRALMVNAAGSMISNVLPAGGAAGVALTWVMFRSWGFGRGQISTSIVVLTIWNMLARLMLPVLGALAVLLGPIDAPRPVLVAAAAAAAIGVLLMMFCAGVIFSDRVATEVGSVTATLVAPLSRRFPRLHNLDTVIADQRAQIDTIVRTRSVRLSLGLVGMFGFLFLLYVVSARAVGLDLGLLALFAAYAFRQFLTVVAITPGGLGITEVGTAGVLVALGADPSAASATALLYAVFTHLLEVPLGVAATALWWSGRTRRQTPTDV